MTPADRTAAGRAEAYLRATLGTFPARAPTEPTSEIAWLAAFLRCAPALLGYHRAHGIPAAVSAATLADLGRQLRVNRVIPGRFGLENWWWIAGHFGGALLQLGRLQFMLRGFLPNEPRPPTPAGDWVLDVHIPAAGPLTPASAADSFRQAAAFFPRHFPAQPATVAICYSWLLDPYLHARLPPNCNLVAFGELFTAYGDPVDAQDDAGYFIFQSRHIAEPATLPRNTSLRRLFIDRTLAGGRWQAVRGFRTL